MTLAIMSFEEAGKCMLLERAGPSALRDVRRHNKKQIASARVSSAREILRHLDEIAAHAEDGYLYVAQIVHEAAGDVLPPEGSPARELLEATRLRLRDEMSRAVSGEIEEAKHRGVYVDLNGLGRVTSTPKDVTAADADFWLDRARGAVKHVSYLVERAMNRNPEEAG